MTDEVYTPWPQWTRMPDPITAHCKCCSEFKVEGHLHCRSWTQARLRKVFNERYRNALTGVVEGGLNSDLNDRRARQWRRARAVQ